MFDELKAHASARHLKHVVKGEDSQLSEHARAEFIEVRQLKEELNKGEKARDTSISPTESREGPPLAGDDEKKKRTTQIRRGSLISNKVK